MVVWCSPRKLCFIPPQRVSRYFTAVHKSPHTSPVKLCHQSFKQKSAFASKPTASDPTKAGWLGWQKLVQLWKPVPIGVGLVLLAVLQWRHIRRRNEDTRNSGPFIANEWEVTCYRAAPLRAMSRVWGWLTNKEVPVSLRPWLYSIYASAFGCNLEEAAFEDLKSYSSLAEFFCRPLKEGSRPIDEVDSIVSPADGTVLRTGRVKSGKVEQVKGVAYTLDAFLGPTTWRRDYNRNSNNFSRTKHNGYHKAMHVNLLGEEQDVVEPVHKGHKYCQTLLENDDTELFQCVIYLAPGDYHRFHSPVNWEVSFRRHFQGELLSVNPTVAKWIPDLFTLNERAAYVGRWKYGFFSLIAVGATNVGSIRVYCDESLVTNEPKWQGCKPRHQDKYLKDADGNPIKVSKGQPFGEFRLGSTIVILFEAPRNFKFNMKGGHRIRVGEGLSRLAT